jgi:hypothetical protein
MKWIADLVIGKTVFFDKVVPIYFGRPSASTTEENLLACSR